MSRKAEAPSALLERARGGDRASLSRALTEIEHATPEARGLLDASVNFEPRVVGWTGAPGAGKSSLLAALIEHRVVAGRRSAVLAVDPTSPLTGGSVLGDRIRMDSLATNRDVFIRSLPSRIREAAIAPATMRMARFLAAAGYEEVHIETVGIGQSDVTVGDLAETTVLVAGPDAGDHVQGLKAGILEIADIFAASKSDLDAAAKTAAILENATTPRPGGWIPPIVPTSTVTNTGIAELSDAIDRHYESLREGGRLDEIRRTRRVAELRFACAALLEAELDSNAAFAEIRGRVERKEIAPMLAAEEFMGRLQR